MTILTTLAIDAVWDDWSEWGECKCSNQEGMQVRTRTLLAPPINGGDWMGYPTESQECSERILNSCGKL